MTRLPQQYCVAVGARDEVAPPAHVWRGINAIQISRVAVAPTNRGVISSIQISRASVSSLGWGSGSARGGAGAPNKGFARRPQEFLGWEEWDWEEEWEWEWEWEEEWEWE